MIGPAPSAMPILQKTALIECWSAVTRLTVPKDSGPVRSGFPALEIRCPYSMQYPGSKKVESGVKRPVSSAAEAVTTLKVEPGAYRPCVARSKRGVFGLHGPWPTAIRLKCFSTRFGLYVGLEARTKTLPVEGSSATAAAHLPARSWFASRCARGLIVVYRLFPLTVTPFTRSIVVWKTVDRFAFEPFR